MKGKKAESAVEKLQDDDKKIGGDNSYQINTVILGRHPAVASFFAHLPTFLRTYPLPAPAGDNYLVPPASRFSSSSGKIAALLRALSIIG